MYHETIHVIEHPVWEEGLVEDDGKFRIEAAFLEHSVETIGWRITEPDTRKYDDDKLKSSEIKGPMVRLLQEEGKLEIGGTLVGIDDVSWIRNGDVLAVVIDTRYCQKAIDLAKGARMLICESTYQEHKLQAKKHFHLTAKQAASIAKEAGAQELILTHFSARYPNGKGFEREAREIFANTHVGEDLKTFPFLKSSSMVRRNSRLKEGMKCIFQHVMNF